MRVKPPQKRPYSFKKQKPKGLIWVNTGNGKGKTTAALGVALRAVGHGWRVSVLQFLKSGKWPCGEIHSAKKMSSALEILPLGEGFTWDTKNPARDKAIVRKAWTLCKKKLSSKKYKLLVFDEINCVMGYGYLPVPEVLRALKRKPKDVHVILTGRGAPSALLKFADGVTEMKEIKHPFRAGVLAQKGIDF